MGFEDNWKRWKEFAKGKRVISIHVDEHDIWEKCKNFDSHRTFIAAAFRLHGFEVTRWGHEYAGEDRVTKWGLVYGRIDSDLRTVVEISGIVGENLKERNSDEGNTKEK